MEQLRGFVDKLPDFFKPWGEEILLRYTDFEGRTDKGTFWKVILVNIIIGAAFFVLGLVPFVGIVVSIISWIYSLAVIVPSIALQVRRLRDAGKAWPFIFCWCIPCVGWIVMLVFFLQPSAE